MVNNKKKLPAEQSTTLECDWLDDFMRSGGSHGLEDEALEILDFCLDDLVETETL
jgi:hypothetical protein